MFDYRDEQDNLQPWSSGWEGSKRGEVHTYPAQPGTIDVIDNDMVRTIKEPLLEKSNGAWSRAGMRYIRDRNDKVFQVVFSTPELSDIPDIINNKCWQHSENATKIKPGMTVYVVPSERALRENPNASGIKFKLGE